MVHERLNGVVRRVKSSLDFYDFDVQIKDKIRNRLIFTDSRGGTTSSVYMSHTSAVSGDTRTIYMKKDYGKVYSYSELNGIIAKNASIIYMHRKGHADTISKGVVDVIKDRLDLTQLAIHIYDVFEFSGACQFAMERGYVRELYDVAIGIFERSGRALRGKKLDKSYFTPNAKVGTIVSNCLSAPFIAAGYPEMAEKVQDGFHEVAASQGIEDELFSHHKEFSEIMAVKNWASSDVFKDRTEKVLELMGKIIPV